MSRGSFEAGDRRVLPGYLLTMTRTPAFLFGFILVAVRFAFADDLTQVSVETVHVSMRDGVLLATDIYRET